MLEVYTFDNINNFNQDFHDKLHSGYHVHKITIYFDKEIINIKDTQCITVRIGNNYPEIYNYSYEFINNKISFTISSINIEYFYNKKNSVKIFCNKNYNIKSFEIEIKKNNVRILCDFSTFVSKKDTKTIRKYVIKSDYFKTFDELIKYIMDDSGLSYELSKKYLTRHGGKSDYYKYVSDDELLSEDDYDDDNSDDDNSDDDNSYKKYTLCEDYCETNTDDDYYYNGSNDDNEDNEDSDDDDDDDDDY